MEEMLEKMREEKKDEDGKMEEQDIEKKEESIENTKKNP